MKKIILSTVIASTIICAPLFCMQKPVIFDRDIAPLISNMQQADALSPQSKQRLLLRFNAVTTFKELLDVFYEVQAEVIRTDIQRDGRAGIIANLTAVIKKNDMKNFKAILHMVPTRVLYNIFTETMVRRSCVSFQGDNPKGTEHLLFSSYAILAAKHSAFAIGQLIQNFIAHCNYTKQAEE